MNFQFHVGLNHYCRVQFHLKQGGGKPTMLKTSSDFSAAYLRNLKKVHLI